jgi:hypothetical protein|tara:strand:+ start:26 stop:235 length:210 start_codon:yes stop_codon:yes gene_type:complete
MSSIYKTPKAIKSYKALKKGLKIYGESIGLESEFFAALTFSEEKGVYEYCECCGGESLAKDIAEIIKKK